MKLEDIGNRNLFKAPEGYFESLPSRVQEKVVQPSPAVHGKSMALAWKVALPAMVLLLAIYLIPINDQKEYTFEESAILEYLEESDLSTAQILEVYQLDDETLASLVIDELDINSTTIENELEWEELDMLLLEE